MPVSMKTGSTTRKKKTAAKKKAVVRKVTKTSSARKKAATTKKKVVAKKAPKPKISGSGGSGSGSTPNTGEVMAAKQREISVSEFFAKNRHLLGFDNPSKALLTTIKELVDNALDACEEAGIAPAITIAVDATSIIIADNGPG